MAGNRTVFRIAAAAWLIGWFIKGSFFLEYFFFEIIDVPIIFDFFPEFFASPILAQVSYLLPLTVLSAFLTTQTAYFRFSALVMVFSSAMLLWHMDSHNDATFVTSFWCGAWLLWLAYRLDDNTEEVVSSGILLAKWILGVVFLGGVVGKLTPEYFNGDVLYQIFVVQKDRSPVVWLFRWAGDGDLRYGSLIIARLSLLAEALIAAAPFLPTRFILSVACLVMPSMIIFSTWRILSVVACLIGLCLACRYWRERSIA